MRAIASTLRAPARRVSVAIRRAPERRVAIRPASTRTAPNRAAPDSATTTTATQAPPAPWEIRVFYDGACPLCMREVNMLRDRDAGVGKIDFVDIDGPGFAASNPPISYEDAMKTIHAVKPDGTLLAGVPVFKELYDRVGLGWVYGFYKFPLLAKAADAVYAVWAALRLPITGRPPLDVVLREKETCRKE